LPAAQRREQLVEAAIRVMTRDGVASATTRVIVAEADVSLSVFHYCFASKQDLLEAVIDAIMEHGSARAMAMVTPGVAADQAIRAAFQAYWDHVVAAPEEHLLTYELTQYALRTPGFDAIARRQYGRYVGAILDFLDQLARSLELEIRTPADVLARYVASLLDGLTLNYLLLGDTEGAQAVLDTAADHVIAQVSSPRSTGSTGSTGSTSRRQS
jgi:AcrR family transcriptional regulator